METAMIKIKRAVYWCRQLLALPFFAIGVVSIGLWSVITGRE